MPQFAITESRWSCYRHWLVLIVVAEAMMLVFNMRLVEIYLAVAVLFAVSFILRFVKFYPGQRELLVLDLSAVVLAAGFAFAAQWLGASGWRFLLILCSSLIVLPYFIYIANEK
jgi:hypothetical protein